MNKIEAVIFDLGRVLVNVDITRGIFGLFGHSFENGTEAAVAQMMCESAYAAFNAGKLSPDQFYEAMKKRYSLDVDFTEVAKRWCDVFDSMEGIEELITDLHGKVRLGLLSDTDPLHWNYICQRFAFVSLFDRPTLSFETGFRKPSRDAYLAAVQNTGVEASQCLYIDDLMENVFGALRAGLEAVHFTGVSKLRQEIVSREIIN
jgi:glucose-1-phosphatase